MTDKHDFKAALEVFIEQNQCNDDEHSAHSMVGMEEHITIQTALRLADRLQSGDVSDDIIKPLLPRGMKPDGVWAKEMIEDFKAMTAQMIKEEQS